MKALLQGDVNTRVLLKLLITAHGIWNPDGLVEINIPRNTIPILEMAGDLSLEPSHDGLKLIMKIEKFAYLSENEMEKG